MGPNGIDIGSRNVLRYQTELRRADTNFNGKIDSPTEVKSAITEIFKQYPIDQLPLRMTEQLRRADAKGIGAHAFNGRIDPEEIDEVVKQQPYFSNENILYQLIYEPHGPESWTPEAKMESSQDVLEKQGFSSVEVKLNLPQARWNKFRLIARAVPDGFGIKDIQKDNVFLDTDIFSIPVGADMPYGEKKLQLTLTIVDPETYEAAWGGDKVFQLTVNGKEVEPSRVFYLGSEKWQPFALLEGGDKKKFLPPYTGVYEFTLPKDMTRVSSMGIMTAGGKNYNVTVTAMKFYVKPETDTRPIETGLQSNQLGYTNDLPKLALFETQVVEKKNEIKPSIQFEIKSSNGQTVFTGKSTPLKFVSDSGNLVGSLDFSGFTQLGKYILVVPQQENVPFAKEISIAIVDKYQSEYRDLAKSSLNAFTWFTSGENGPYKNTHQQDKAAQVYGSSETRDVRGGWHDAGDYGKYAVTGAYSVGLMLLTRDYLTNGWTMDVGKDVPRKQADRPDVLSYARQELDFLLMLQEPNGGVHHKVAAADWLQENVAPEEDTQVKTVMPVTTTATADFAAVMAKGWLHFRDSKVSEDRSMAFKYLTAAKKAWAFLTEHPSLMMIPEMYNGQSYGGLYGDSIDRDERLWAAVELFRATNDDKFHSYIKQNILKSVLTDRLGDKTPDWSNVNFMAIFSYLQSATADSEIKQQLITHVTTYANKLLDQQRENPYQIAFAGAGNTFAWGSNSVIATTALQLAYVYKLTGNAEYKKGAAKMMNYLLGMNPNGISYVTGFGSNSVQHPHFRPHASGKYPLPKGLLIGGPNNTEFKGDLLAEAKTGDAPMKFFSDQQGSYATNEVAINWQATLAAVTALLSE